MAFLAMYNDASMLRQRTPDVRLDLVFLLLRIVSRHLAIGVAPGFLDDALLAEEVGAFEGAFFVGGFEDETIAEIEGEDASFFASEGRDE